MARSGMDILWLLLGGQRNFFDAYRQIEKQDAQSAELFKDTFDKLAKELEISSNSEHALYRVRSIVENCKKWHIALIRNNVFKAADMMGIKLPSAMFASDEGDLRGAIQKLAKEKPELREHLVPLLKK